MRASDYCNRGIGAATSNDSTLGLRNIQVRGQIKMWGSFADVSETCAPRRRTYTHT